MFRKHKLAIAVAGTGALTMLVHGALGAAGIMTAAQWQSGVTIGMVVLMVGVMRAAMSD